MSIRDNIASITKRPKILTLYRTITIVIVIGSIIEITNDQQALANSVQSKLTGYGRGGAHSGGGSPNANLEMTVYGRGGVHAN